MFHSEAKSISQLFEVVNQFFEEIKLSTFGLYFRGQSRFDHRLIPSILRQGKLYDGEKLREMEMYREFQLLKGAQDNTLRSNFEWLVQMQHYGIPTRLLDWSQNLLVALYFAIQDSENDGALFVLEPLSLNLLSDRHSGPSMFDRLNNQVIIRANLSGMNTLEDFVEREEIRKILTDHEKTLTVTGDKLNDEWWQRTIETPIAIKPPIQNDRIFLQRGVFTLHGGKIFGDKVIIQPTHIEDFAAIDELKLAKIKIPSTAKVTIRKQLDYSGVNEAALYPELEHQSNYVRERWTSKTA